jgi:hypothetical protein
MLLQPSTECQDRAGQVAFSPSSTLLLAPLAEAIQYRMMDRYYWEEALNIFSHSALISEWGMGY